MEDWPQLTDANLISRAGMVTAQLSKPVPLRPARMPPVMRRRGLRFTIQRGGR